MPTSRNTRRLRRIKAHYRATRPQPCLRCGQPIDYDAAPGEPNAFNLGHIKPWSQHPELREDPGNLQQEHETCNKAAGDKTTLPGLGLTSQAW